MSKSSEKPKKQQKQKPQKTLKERRSEKRAAKEARFRFLSPSRQVEEPGSSMDDYEVVAEELSQLADKMRGLEERLAEVERVNTRLEEAALTTARALAEVSRHGTRCTTLCAVRTESNVRSRPSATAMRLGRVAARHRLRVVTPGARPDEPPSSSENRPLDLLPAPCPPPHSRRSHT